jgi:NAD(P)-dependent dehydrogenase (short-subunit alcohol dehydrogenase family)
LLSRERPVQVRDGGSGLASAVVERLRAEGFAATSDPGSPRGSLVLLDGLAEIDSPAAGVDVCREVFRAVRSHLQAAPDGVVTLQDTGGDFGLGGRAGARAWLGGLPGLVKTAAQEHPERRFRAVDLERGGRAPLELAEAVVRELISGGPELEVGLRADGTRLALATALAPASAEGPLPGTRDVVVVSGGGRGVTAACALALARASRPGLALLGRTPLAEEAPELLPLRDRAALQRALIERAVAAGRTPSPADLRAELARVLSARELRDTLEAIRATGARVVYRSVDVADPAALAAALEAVRGELGPITGVIHGAGALSDRRLVEKTDADLERVLAPKVRGLEALLAATREDPVRWLLLFSSVAARAGNPGQADYALANEILNPVAASEAAGRGAGVVVRALGWGPWEGGMVDATAAERFRKRGVPLIPVEAGAAALLDELRSPGGAPVVILGEAPALAAASPARAPRAPHRFELEVRVEARSHGYLDGHRIRGVPVLPLALALDWLARAAAHCRPDLSLLACRDVQVRSGIRLDRFESGGHVLVASAREVSNGAAARLALELRGDGGRVHYTASAEMGAPPVAPRPVPAAAVRAGSAPWSASEVYDGERLFHGPAFHAIRSLEGLDAETGTAVLAGLAELGWPAEAWQIDAAALDGSLQLALLHARLVLGCAALPTGIASLLRQTVGPAQGPVHCALRMRSRSALQITSDIVLSDASGAPLLELHGVQVTALPAAGDAAVPVPVEDSLSR